MPLMYVYSPERTAFLKRQVMKRKSYGLTETEILEKSTVAARDVNTPA